jgi:hypothetical protein
MKVCNKFKNLYKLLKARPFCKCAVTEKELYDAYCLRIIETLEIMEDKNGKEKGREK